MNLRSLAPYDQRTASGILAGLALGSTTNPGVGVAAEFEAEIGERELSVLSEIREGLKLPPDDNSVEARGKILDVVSRALSDSLLEGKDRHDIMARAGSKGLLPPTMYNIELHPHFLHQFGQFAVREQHARQTIVEADDYQHLITQRISGPSDTFSLFLKWHPGQNLEHGFWALVFTHRVGTTLLVQHLWRVYTSDVDISQANRPVDVLKQFCEKFGVDVQLGDRTAKFFEQTTLPSSAGKTADDVLRYIKVDPKADLLTTVSARKTTMGASIEAGVVYAIDVPRYKASLRRHGVMVR